jgi:hypothetical protein
MPIVARSVTSPSAPFDSCSVFSFYLSFMRFIYAWEGTPPYPLYSCAFYMPFAYITE